MNTQQEAMQTAIQEQSALVDRVFSRDIHPPLYAQYKTRCKCLDTKKGGHTDEQYKRS